MSEDKKIETLETFITALQSGDLELAARVSSADFVISGLMVRPLDQNEFLALQGELLAAMPDFSYNLADVKRDGDDVQALINISGTQTNDLSWPVLGLSPIQATGLAVDLPQTRVVCQIEDGQVLAMEVEQVVGGGLAGLLQQIGAELPLMPRERVREDPTDPPENFNPPDVGQS
jgi:hypothetical protein